MKDRLSPPANYPVRLLIDTDTANEIDDLMDADAYQAEIDE